MAKIFLGLAIAVMIGAAAVAFLTKGNVDIVQTKLKDTKATLATTQKNLADTKATLKKTQDDLTAANNTIEEQKSLIAKTKGELDAANAKVTDLTTQLDDKTKQLADLNAKLQEAMKGTGGDDPKLLGEKITQLTQALQKAETEVAEQKQVVETMTARVKETDEKLQVANAEVERYRKNVAKQGLTGRILAVNSGWNFIVLSVGDKQGAAVGANMLVVRGGEPIGKAKISSVEPSTSIADIIPGSIRRGVSVQPGDTVIYEGQRK